MSSPFRRMLAVGMLALGVGTVAPAFAQQVAPPADLVPAAPVAAEPYRVEASTPRATTRMLAEDAERYLEQLGITTTPPSTGLGAGSETPQQAGGSSAQTARTSQVDPNAVRAEEAPSPQGPSRSPSETAATAPAGGGGISRTITVEAAVAVSTSPLFTFRDVTDRAADGPAPAVPLAQRQAAVEAYRQSLPKGGAAGR